MIALIGLAWKLRWLIGAAALVVVFGLAVAWHANKVRQFGNERFAAGEAKVQAAWDRAVVEAERLRNAERRRAAEELSMRELEQLKEEEADDARIATLQEELARALATNPDLPRIPGGLLGPRRRLGAR